MKPIAIITATPNGINPGMLAGEAAAKAAMEKAGFTQETTFFRLLSLEERILGQKSQNEELNKACYVGIAHRTISDPVILDDYLPLFWGDFLHMRRYINALAGSDPLLERAYRKILLLEGSSNKTLQNTISYGTSFLFNSTADYQDPEYGSSLSRFLRNASHIQMRDAVSAAMVANYRSHKIQPCGIDPVQLLALPEIEAAILSEMMPRQPVNRALVFLARGQHCKDQLMAFIEQIATSTDTACYWLPWGDQLSFPFMERENWPWPSVELLNDPRGYGVLAPLLAAIRDSRFVVTDTYHVAVSSWALGVPAILVTGTYHDGERVGKEVDLRTRLDKRTILMGQDGLLDFCIDSTLLTLSNRAAVCARLISSIVENQIGKSFRHVLARRVENSQEALLSAVTALR